MTRGAHPVPLEVREGRVRELLERLAEAVARAGFGEVADTTFLAPEVAERLHSLAAAYGESGIVAEPEFGDEGQAVAHFPEERSEPVVAELVVHDRSVVLGQAVAMPTRQSWRFVVETDGLVRRIEWLRVEAVG
jgi:hypothetical protein